MIWVLQVFSVVLYVVFVVLIIVYLVISSRTRICLRKKVDDPICFDDWKCEGEDMTATRQLIHKLKSKPKCTLNTIQETINKQCENLEGTDYEECVACVVYSTSEIFECKPEWSYEDPDNDLNYNYNKAINDVTGAIKNYSCDQQIYCKYMKDVSWTLSKDLKNQDVCTPIKA